MFSYRIIRVAQVWFCLYLRPMKPELIKNLAQIWENYDAILSDVWGVIHNGANQYAPAVNALQAFRKRAKPVVLISNAPRPNSQIPPQLDRLGIKPETYDTIVTSGDATIEAARKYGTRAFRIGGAKDDFFFDSIGVQYVSIEEAEFIICTGPRNDLVETAEDYRDELRQLAQFKLPFICANPDRVVQMGDRLIYCGGALADIYAEYFGEVVMAGKPFSPIYEICFDKLEEITGKRPDKSRILCIGDGPITDVLGANRQGLDCLFVAGGIHGEELKGVNGLDEDKTIKFLKSQNLAAKYAIYELE